MIRTRSSMSFLRTLGMKSKNHKSRRNRARRQLQIQMLEGRLVMATTPLISEFLASNSGGLQDSDGESSDWIEIYNPTSSAVNLNGWYLTDSTSDLNQWQFPSAVVAPNGFLTVFASGKNRVGSELHTSFRLSSTGEYLALVTPTGTVVSEFEPNFPTQVNNVSYGALFDSAELVQAGAATQVKVPTQNIGTTWRNPTFDPVGWTTGTTGVGFGIVQPGFNISYIKSNVPIDDLDVARNVAVDPGMQDQYIQTTAPVVNYLGNGGGANFANDLPFPTQNIGDDYNDFLIQAFGTVTIPSTGDWTFGVNSDDGFGLRLERNGTVFLSEYPSPRGPSDTLATFAIPEAGNWEVSLIFYERGGGASVEMFAAPGAFGTFSPADFRLVGDSANGGLAVFSTVGGGSSVVVGTNIETSMKNVNGSAYVRVPFNMTNPTAYDTMILKMRYDDGFVAYLNGVEVARSNAPATVAFNSNATVDRSLIEAVTPETINLSAFIGQLRVGANVLAIQGLNSSPSDDSFLVLPELSVFAVHPETQRYFATPSPGQENTDPSLGIVDTPTATMPAGFYTTSITVGLNVTTSGAQIRYTLDGSEPTETNGMVYAGPFVVNSTRTLRARAFKTDYFALPSITVSYLYLDDVIRQSPSDDVPGGDPDVGAPPAGWPEAWGGNVVDYGMDQTVVNQLGAETVKNALRAIPSISISTDLVNLFDPATGIYANAYQDGRDWERPASVELLNPDGSAGFQINAGLRIRGGYSRSSDNPKHAFRLFFRNEYGDSTLDYPLFGSEGTNSFRKIDLRTSQNYSWSFGGDPSNSFIQDVFARKSQGDMGQPYTRSRWYHLYLNGQYWGIFQTQERAEAEFAASYFGGIASNYDVIKPEAGPYTIYATDGDLNAYQRLWDAAKNQDLSSNANYFRLQGKNALGVDDPSIPNDDVYSMSTI
jgi:Lamin Tail Domain/Chitobiase/beta-hexosaminidase C-terminal domain/CotH kinase protein